MIAEVYTFEALLVALVILVLLLWRDRRDSRYLLLSAFLVGLSLTHHLTSVLLVPAALAFVFLTDRRVFSRTGLMAKGVGIFLLGLLPLLYLPIRAMMHAPLNEADPSTPWRFLLLVTGGSFLAESSEKGRHCSPSSLTLADTSTKLGLFGDHLLGQFPLFLIVVGVLAAFYLLFTDRATAVLLGALFFGCFGPGRRLPPARDRGLLRVPHPRLSGFRTVHLGRPWSPAAVGGEPGDRLYRQRCPSRYPLGPDASRTVLGRARLLRWRTTVAGILEDARRSKPWPATWRRAPRSCTTGARSGTWCSWRGEGRTSP